MAKVELSRSDEWELEHESQDVRGWEVVDASGKRMGTVTELIIDTDRERVDTLVLDSGERVTASAASLGDHVVRLAGSTSEAGGEATRSGELAQLRIGRRSTELGGEQLRPRDGDRTSVMPPSTIEDPSLREARMGGARIGGSQMDQSRLDETSGSFEPGSGSLDSGSASLSSAERRRSEGGLSEQQRAERERTERERRGSLGSSGESDGSSSGL